MATFEQLMNAAANAKKAGAEADARVLFDEAKRLFPDRFTKTPAAPDFAVPPPVTDTHTVTGTDGKNYELAGKEAPKPAPYRFGTVFGSTVEDPAAATSAFYKGATGSGPSPSAAYLTEQGVHPLVVEALSGLGDIGMTALAALGTGVAGIAGAAGELVPGSRTDKQKLANDLMMMSQVGVPELAGVSSTALGVAGKAGSAAKITEPTSAGRIAAQAAEDVGITPSIGMTGKTGAMFAAAMEKMPFAGSLIARDAQRAVGEIAAAVKASTAKIGPAVGPQQAGEALQAGLRSYVDRFKANSAKWFGDIPIEPGMRVEIPATLKAVAESREAFKTNPELAAKLGLTGFDKVFEEAAANGMTWQALKDFRSKIGEAVGSIKGPLADQADGNLKSLYATLTQDMEAAAKKAGPEAYSAWKSANEKYKAGAERISNYLDATISAKSPERAFEAFDRMTAEGSSSADAIRMRKIKASMKPSEWGTVAASIVDRLGTARAGAQNAAGDAFSAGEFLTNWNKLTPQAKELLLPGDVRLELNRLATVAERAKAANLERNFSNTGTVGAWSALLFTGPKTAAGAIGGSYITAKAMTSPIFLNAVNRFIAGDRTALARMAEGQGAFTQDAKTILRLAAQEASAGSAANANADPRAYGTK